MASFTSPPSVEMPNNIIHPTRANIVLSQRDHKRAGDDERYAVTQEHPRSSAVVEISAINVFL